MNNNFGKFAGKLKKVVIFVGLFSAIFFFIFWIINLDLGSIKNSKSNLNSISPVFNEKGLGISEVKSVAFKEWAQVNGLFGDDIANLDTDKDELSNYLEYIHLTDPNNPDTDSDGYFDSAEIRNGYDPDDRGDSMLMVGVEIEKIGVRVPMVWSKTEDDREMLKDLENGIAHFARTATPGQSGNMIISGHSSNYIWAKGDYNHIFKNLNDLEKGDMVTVRTVQKNGRAISYKYVVTDKFVAYPDDERIFAETKNSTLTLTTCWPIGTTFKRAIIKAELVK